MNVAARCVARLTLFSAKSNCTVSFRLMKIPLTSNKDPKNVDNRPKDAGKLLKVHFKVHFKFKLKVELEVCNVCYITGNCSQKYGNPTPLISRNSHLLATL